MFNLFSWGAPALVSMVTVFIHFFADDDSIIITPGFGEDTCFFSSYLARLVYLHGIIATLLLINLIFFLLSAYNLLFGLWSSRDGDTGSVERSRQMLLVVVELFLVMGLTWLAEVVSLIINWRRGAAYSGVEIIIFDIINSLQGLLIFIVLVCKPRMRSKIRAAVVSLFSCLDCHKPSQATSMARIISLSTVHDS